MTQDEKLDLLLDRTAKIYTHVEVLKAKVDNESQRTDRHEKSIDTLQIDNQNYKVERGKIIGGGVVAGTFFSLLGAGAMKVIDHLFK